MIFVFSTLNELFLIRTGLRMGNYFPLFRGYSVQMFPCFPCCIIWMNWGDGGKRLHSTPAV